MRTRLRCVRTVTRVPSLLLAVLAVLGATPKSGYSQRPQFRVSYVPPTSAQDRFLYSYLREVRFLESAATRLNGYLRLRKPILLVVSSCSKANASFDPNSNTVRLCYQLVSEIMDPLSELPNDDMSLAGSVDAGMDMVDEAISISRFFLFHEVGHALIATLRLPVTGRKEDAADQLGIVLLEKNFGGPNGPAGVDIAGAGLVFSAWARDQGITYDALTDVHALPDQRAANITCWEYASDTTGVLRPADRLLLSSARVNQCEEEWGTIRASWTALLRPFIRSN